MSALSLSNAATRIARLLSVHRAAGENEGAIELQCRPDRTRSEILATEKNLILCFFCVELLLAVRNIINQHSSSSVFGHMSGKRQAETLDDISPAKKQKLDKGVACNGGVASAQPSAASMMEKIAKAKKLLESQKALQAKLAAAKLKVRLNATGMVVLSQGGDLYMHLGCVSMLMLQLVGCYGVCLLDSMHCCGTIMQQSLLGHSSHTLDNKVLEQTHMLPHVLPAHADLSNLLIPPYTLYAGTTTTSSSSCCHPTRTPTSSEATPASTPSARVATPRAAPGYSQAHLSASSPQTG